MRALFLALILSFGIISGNALAAPEAPVMSYSTSWLNISIDWNAVSGATGYLLNYAPKPYTGPDSIGTVDLGNQTSFNHYLWEGASYFIAVQSYDGFGNTSSYSNIQSFTINTQSAGGGQSIGGSCLGSFHFPYLDLAYDICVDGAVSAESCGDSTFFVGAPPENTTLTYSTSGCNINSIATCTYPTGVTYHYGPVSSEVEELYRSNCTNYDGTWNGNDASGPVDTSEVYCEEVPLSGNGLSAQSCTYINYVGTGAMGYYLISDGTRFEYSSHETMQVAANLAGEYVLGETESNRPQYEPSWPPDHDPLHISFGGPYSDGRENYVSLPTSIYNEGDSRWVRLDVHEGVNYGLYVGISKSYVGEPGDFTCALEIYDSQGRVIHEYNQQELYVWSSHLYEGAPTGCGAIIEPTVDATYYIRVFADHSRYLYDNHELPDELFTPTGDFTFTVLRENAEADQGAIANWSVDSTHEISGSFEYGDDRDDHSVFLPVGDYEVSFTLVNRRPTSPALPGVLPDTEPVLISFSPLGRLATGLTYSGQTTPLQVTEAGNYMFRAAVPTDRGWKSFRNWSDSMDYRISLKKTDFEFPIETLPTYSQ